MATLRCRAANAVFFAGIKWWANEALLTMDVHELELIGYKISSDGLCGFSSFLENQYCKCIDSSIGFCLFLTE